MYCWPALKPAHIILATHALRNFFRRENTAGHESVSRSVARPVSKKALEEPPESGVNQRSVAS